MHFTKTNYIWAWGILISLGACKKIIAIPPPIGTVTTSQVFSTDDQATTAAAGMYYNMINGQLNLASGALTVYSGMSADELFPFDQTNMTYLQFQQNNLIATNGIVGGNFWASAYSYMYTANAIISGLTGYYGVHDSVKNELTGEAEFVRAFCNFYLINLYGDVPLVTTTNWQKTNLLGRSQDSAIYHSIIADLRDAQTRLAADFSVAHGERIIPNKWAATALLARVYLYTKDYADAETQANSVINYSSLFSLTPDVNNIFLINSSEAIWQLKQTNDGYSYNTTPEGYRLIPATLNGNVQPPFVCLTSQFLNSFEPGDIRKTSWIDSTLYNGVEYYFPYKYKMGLGQATPGGPYSEYYMVLRLTEQFLIRAEAEAQLGDMTDAAADLNKIRNRANLSNTTASSQTDLLAAIAHERQIELFAEWGNRWLDLKRTAQATQVLSLTKGFTVTANSLLYPIPQGELLIDPNLVQNPGYAQ